MSRGSVTKPDGSRTDFSIPKLLAIEPGELIVPLREIQDSAEGIAFGFRQSMLDLGDGVGSVATGSGLGTDFIILEWKGRTAFCRGSEMLKAYVMRTEPDEAERFPKEVT